MSKDPGSIPGTSTIWFGPRLVQLEFGSAWIGIQLTFRGPGFSQRKFIYLVRQIAIAEVETPISPMIVGGYLLIMNVSRGGTLIGITGLVTGVLSLMRIRRIRKSI